MKRTASSFLCLLAAMTLAVPVVADELPKKVLIVVEGATSLRNYAIADGRQLATLLGHFTVTTKVLGVREYQRGEVEAHDIVFYIGFHASNVVPSHFLDDILATTKTVVWMNTGFREFSLRPEVKSRFGFTVARFDSVSEFSSVKMGRGFLRKGS